MEYQQEQRASRQTSRGSSSGQNKQPKPTPPKKQLRMVGMEEVNAPTRQPQAVQTLGESEDEIRPCYPSSSRAPEQTGLSEDTIQLRAPDTFKKEKVEVYDEKGNPTSTHLSKDQRFKILGKQAKKDKTTLVQIEYFKWNKTRPISDRMERNEVYVLEDDITKGSTKQTSLEDINKVREQNGKQRVEILPKDARGINQKDVYQAGVSDCYLQAALVALAEKSPDKIFQMIDESADSVTITFHLPKAKNFTTFLQTEDGLKKNLEEKRITVKKSLFLDENEQLVYGGKINDDTYLWPAFVQKAWAVVKGGYAETAMAHPSDVFEAITGEGKIGAMPSSPWEVYEKIKEALSTEKTVVLSTGVFAKEKFIKKLLNSRKNTSQPWDMPHGKVRTLHAYVVMRMEPSNLEREHVNEKSSKKIKLTLRDPREPTGKTFERTLEEVITDKFNGICTW